MRMQQKLLFFLVICSVWELGKQEEQLSYKECEDLGFTGLALCSDCNTFAEFVKNDGNRSITLTPSPSLSLC